MQFNKWMIGLGFCGLLAGLTGSAAADEQPADAAELEPPQQLVVTVDGEAIGATAGVPMRVKINGEWVELLIEATGERTFDNGNVSFDYLDEMAFAFDGSEPGLQLWDFNGQDCVIMVQQTSPDIDFKEYRRELLNVLAMGYGEMFDKRESIQIALGGEKLEGEMFTASLKNMGVALTQQIFFIQRGEVGTVLIFQDALGDNGEHSAEFISMVDRLERTLRWSDLGKGGE